MQFSYSIRPIYDNSFMDSRITDASYTTGK